MAIRTISQMAGTARGVNPDRGRRLYPGRHGVGVAIAAACRGYCGAMRMQLSNINHAVQLSWRTHVAYRVVTPRMHRTSVILCVTATRMPHA
jgi:hypothetical protein